MIRNEAAGGGVAGAATNGEANATFCATFCAAPAPCCQPVSTTLLDLLVVRPLCHYMLLSMATTAAFRRTLSCAVQPISTISLDLLDVRAVMHAPVVTLREQMQLGDIRWVQGRLLGGSWGAAGHQFGRQVFARMAAGGSRFGREQMQLGQHMWARLGEEIGSHQCVHAGGEAGTMMGRCHCSAPGTMHDACRGRCRGTLSAGTHAQRGLPCRRIDCRDVLRKTRHNGFPVVRDTPQVRAGRGLEVCACASAELEHTQECPPCAPHAKRCAVARASALGSRHAHLPPPPAPPMSAALPACRAACAWGCW